MLTYSIYLNTIIIVQELHVPSGRSKPQNNLEYDSFFIYWLISMFCLENHLTRKGHNHCWQLLYATLKPHGKLWFYGAYIMKWR